MRRAELITAVLMAALSIYLMIKSAELPIGWIPGEGPGGGFWPFWLAAIMLISSGWIVVNWFRRSSPPSQSEEPYMDAYATKMFLLVGGGVTVMIGLVEKFVTLKPRQIKLRGITGETIKSKLTLIPEKKYPFKILNVRAKDGKYINFRLEEIKQADSIAYELNVENLRQESGRYYDDIILETDSKIKPELNIKVYGYLRPRTKE